MLPGFGGGNVFILVLALVKIYVEVYFRFGHHQYPQAEARLKWRGKRNYLALNPAGVCTRRAEVCGIDRNGTHFFSKPVRRHIGHLGHQSLHRSWPRTPGATAITVSPAPLHIGDAADMRGYDCPRRCLF